MKLTTIGLAALFALSGTFALAQTGGAGSAGASAGAGAGTTTGRDTSGAANQGSGAQAIQSDKMKADTGTTGSSVNNSPRPEQGHANQQNGSPKNDH